MFRVFLFKDQFLTNKILELTKLTIYMMVEPKLNRTSGSVVAPSEEVLRGQNQRNGNGQSQRRKYYNKPIRTQSTNKQVTKRAGKRMWPSRDMFYFASDWQRERRGFSWPITEWINEQPMQYWITFNTDHRNRRMEKESCVVSDTKLI